MTTQRLHCALHNRDYIAPATGCAVCRLTHKRVGRFNATHKPGDHVAIVTHALQQDPPVSQLAGRARVTPSGHAIAPLVGEPSSAPINQLRKVQKPTKKTKPKKRKAWTPEDAAKLAQLYPSTSSAKLAEIFDRSLSSIYGQAQKMSLKKNADYLSTSASGRIQPGDTIGENNQFKKGHKPFNKGIKGWKPGGRSQETQFKKGNVSGRAAQLEKPIGTERFSKDGYLQRKISATGKASQRWKAVHNIIWEESHGPIPDGHAVAFINGDKTDLRLENLELLSRAELMNRNTIHRYPPELVSVMHLSKKLQRKTYGK